jgi:hypothetical protein
VRQWLVHNEFCASWNFDVKLGFGLILFILVLLLLCFKFTKLFKEKTRRLLRIVCISLACIYHAFFYHYFVCLAFLLPAFVYYAIVHMLGYTCKEHVSLLFCCVSLCVRFCSAYADVIKLGFG